jgi:hypothetical protein
MPHVFISYVRENESKVKKICDLLRKHGIDAWVDREQIRPGQPWRQAIRTAIEDGAFFLACFSDEYTSRLRTYMNEELICALDEIRRRPMDRSWFIPVLLSGDKVPYREIGGGMLLSDLQWVDLGKDWDDGVRRIIGVVRSAFLAEGIPDQSEIENFIKNLNARSTTETRVGTTGYRRVGNSITIMTGEGLFRISKHDDQSVGGEWEDSFVNYFLPLDSQGSRIISDLITKGEADICCECINSSQQSRHDPNTDGIDFRDESVEKGILLGKAKVVNGVLDLDDLTFTASISHSDSVRTLRSEDEAIQLAVALTKSKEN